MIGKLKIPVVIFALATVSATQQAPSSGSAHSGAAAQNGHAILLTVFLKHDQSKTLDQLENQLQQTGFYRDFPPPGTEVVSWYVMMGIGQVVTLRVPAERLRETNRYFEQRAWGAFHTEFFPTYDFIPAWRELKGQQQKR